MAVGMCSLQPRATVFPAFQQSTCGQPFWPGPALLFSDSPVAVDELLERGHRGSKARGPLEGELC